MDIDFSLVLVILVSISGSLWLLDVLLIKRSRLEAIQNYTLTQARGKKNSEIESTVAELSKEPLVIEYIFYKTASFCRLSTKSI